MRYLVEINLHQDCAIRTNTFLKVDSRAEARAIARAILSDKYAVWTKEGRVETLAASYKDSYIRIIPYE